MTRRCTPALVRLTVITDPDAPAGVIETVGAALRGGATAIQLRWKGGSGRDMVLLGHELRRLTTAANALLIVNDRVDVALAISADGAHLGDDDLPLEACRAIVPPDFLLGRSVDTAGEAAMAEEAGADYVGFGPIFNTGSKDGLGDAVGVQGIAAVREVIRIPLVAIGGITARAAKEVTAAGADGIAVIAAVMRSADPGAAAAELLAGAEAGMKGRHEEEGRSS